jgi:NAD(P)-dependent dehydrogenase (short-subunit alcohol dehydrogenase family)
MRYQNKVAVITGGSSGIGLAVAKQLIQEGARIAISGRDPAALEAAKLAHGFLAIRADVSSLADIDRFYAEVSQAFGKIDFLFANAGIYKAAPLAETSEALFDEVMNINIKGVFFTVQKALPYLNDNAAIVLNSSILNQKAWPGNSIYSASKAAVRSLARSFAVDLIARGIRVNTVSPGPTATPIFGRLGLPEAELQGIAAGILAGIPMKRFGSPEEIASAVLFLGSSESSFMTGAEIAVDGGLAQV